MTVQVRRIIYLSFIVIFLIVAPSLLLYANGYRYNLKRWKIERTGIIFLTSEQKDISIYLNNEPYSFKLNKSLSLGGLLPDEYQIRAEKEGYYSWQKKLTVFSGQTTFTTDVALFKKGLPSNLALGKINWLSLSPDKEKIVYLLRKENSQELWLINLETDQSMLLYKLPSVNLSNLKDLKWAPSYKKILINIETVNKKRSLVFNLERPGEIIALSDFKETYNYFRWDENSDNILYGVNNNKLYQIDLATKKSTLLLELENNSKENLIDYMVINNETIYYIKTDGANSFILKTNLKDKTGNAPRIKLVKSSDYVFLGGNRKFLTVLDEKKQNLFLISDEFFENIASAEKNEDLINRLEAKNAFWRPGSDQLLYYNDFEIWVYDFKSNKKELINRYSEKIKEVVWYPNYEYLIALVENEIRILEISNREKNAVNLIKLEDINNINIDREGAKIYFIGQIGRQEGLYELEIQ